MRQVLISKDLIAKELKTDVVTLREIHKFCEQNSLRVVAVDKHFIIADDSNIDEYRHYEIMDRLEKISRHFNNSYY